MARFLFAPVPITGHVAPGIPIATELIRRGHEVRWYTTPKFEDKVKSIGAVYVPYKKATLIDEARIDEQFPERTKLKGIAQLKFDMKSVFADQVPTLLDDLSDELHQNPADVLVGDTVSGVCALLAKKHRIRWAVYGISVFLQKSRDTAPFGLGILPKDTPLGRLRNSTLYWLVDNVLFKDVFAYSAAMNEKLGFGKPEYPMLEFARGADLFLQGCSPSFEYPRSDLPANVRFIGAFVPPVPQSWTPPDWWEKLNGGKPVVVVTQGTIANEYGDLILPAIEALAAEDCLVIVTTGSKPPDALGLTSLPPNVVVEQFVPYAALLPKASLLLTNGGYGSIQIALTYGVPVVAFGASEEKPEIANRVTWSGVGVGVKAKKPTPAQIRTAVRTVLSGPSFTARAQKMRDELRAYDAAALSGDYLEGLLTLEK